MAGGRRSDRLSARDVEVLGFIARFGIVPREAVMAGPASGPSTVLNHPPAAAAPMRTPAWIAFPLPDSISEEPTHRIGISVGLARHGAS
jgi:hypothetical protein